MADDDVRDVAGGAVSTRDGRDLTYLEVGDPHGPLVIHNHGGPSSRLRGTPARGRRIEEPAATRLRRPARHGTVQSAEDTQLLRLGRRHGDDRRRVGIPRIRRDRLVGGWPMGAGRSRLHRSRLDCATSAASRAEATEHSVTIGRRNHLSKIDAFGGTLALRFKPGFRLMYAALGITAKHFREQLRRTGAEIGQRLRPTDSASARDRNGLRRRMRRMLRTRFRRTGSRR